MPARRFTDAQEVIIAQRYLAGESLRSMARELKTDHNALASSLRRQGVTQREAPERNRLYPLDAHVFDVIDTEAKAYWLGFLFADGNVSKRSLSVVLQDADSAHLALLGKLIQTSAPIQHRIVHLHGKDYPSAGITVTDQYLATRLRELGIIPKRSNLLGPLPHIPSTLQRHWIRGFFDGDGSVKIKPSAIFCGNKSLLEYIQSLLAPHIKRQGSIYAHSKSHVWYLCYAGRLSCLALRDYLYQDATVLLMRKFERFNAWPEPATNYWERPRKNGRWLKAP